jgi:hypothetical protein
LAGGANQQTWGNVTYVVEQSLQQPPNYQQVGRALTLAVPRKPVWKQLALVPQPNPAVAANWFTAPGEATIQLQKYPKKPMVEWAKPAIQRAHLDHVPETQIKKTFDLVAIAVGQVHFRYFNRAIITGQGGHTSSSDPTPHATVTLGNLDLDDQINSKGVKGMVMKAHIYHDAVNFTYTGYRIFVGSPVDP